MDTVRRADDDTSDPGRETYAERQHRLAWEAERIAEADDEIEAGLYVDPTDIKAWIDSLGTDHALPPPPIRSR